MNRLSDNEFNIQVQNIGCKIFACNEFKITYENRLFGLYESGEIQNPDDKQRNVAFKVVTFLNFLNKFYDTLMDKSKYRNPKKSEDEHNLECTTTMNEALFNAGVQCGESFGEALLDNNKWKNDENFGNSDWRLKQWCEFDTRAGFGRMLYIENDRVIEIKNLFIRNSKITQGRDYTAFFNGYMIGVLTKIVVDKLKLTTLQIKIIKEHNIDNNDFKSIFEKKGTKINYMTELLSDTNEFILYIIKEV